MEPTPTFIVIGYGATGHVTEYMLSHRHVFTYDIDPEKGADYIGGAFPIASAYFICTHEDDAPGVIEKIRETNPTAFIVVRSTILPGFCDIYSEKDSPVLHLPAFHTQKNAVQDYMRRVKTIVIGTRSRFDGLKLRRWLFPTGKEFIITDPNSSALSKLANNTRLGMQISFWNEIYTIAEHFDADINSVARIVCKDDRHQYYGTSYFDEPWGGQGLPKDIYNTIKLVDNKDGVLLKSIVESNRKLEELKEC